MVKMIKWDGRYCVPSGFNFWYSPDFRHFGFWREGEQPLVYERELDGSNRNRL